MLCRTSLVSPLRTSEQLQIANSTLTKVKMQFFGGKNQRSTLDFNWRKTKNQQLSRNITFETIVAVSQGQYCEFRAFGLGEGEGGYPTVYHPLPHGGLLIYETIQARLPPFDRLNFFRFKFEYSCLITAV